MNNKIPITIFLSLLTVTLSSATLDFRTQNPINFHSGLDINDNSIDNVSEILRDGTTNLKLNENGNVEVSQGDLKVSSGEILLPNDLKISDTGVIESKRSDDELYLDLGSGGSGKLNVRDSGGTNLLVVNEDGEVLVKEGALNLTNSRITDLKNPQEGKDAANFAWVESNFLNRSGDTMSGNIDMNGYNITDIEYLNLTSGLEIDGDIDTKGGNVILDDGYISNDGDDEGLKVDNSGNVIIPSGYLNMSGKDIKEIGGLQNCEDDQYVGGDGTCKNDDGSNLDERVGVDSSSDPGYLGNDSTGGNGVLRTDNSINYSDNSNYILLETNWSDALNLNVNGGLSDNVVNGDELSNSFCTSGEILEYDSGSWGCTDIENAGDGDPDQDLEINGTEISLTGSSVSLIPPAADEINNTLSNGDGIQTLSFNGSSDSSVAVAWGDASGLNSSGYADDFSEADDLTSGGGIAVGVISDSEVSSISLSSISDSGDLAALDSVNSSTIDANSVGSSELSNSLCSNDQVLEFTSGSWSCTDTTNVGEDNQDLSSVNASSPPSIPNVSHEIEITNGDDAHIKDYYEKDTTADEYNNWDWYMDGSSKKSVNSGGSAGLDSGNAITLSYNNGRDIQVNVSASDLAGSELTDNSGSLDVDLNALSSDSSISGSDYDGSSGRTWGVAWDNASDLGSSGGLSNNVVNGDELSDSLCSNDQVLEFTSGSWSCTDTTNVGTDDQGLPSVLGNDNQANMSIDMNEERIKNVSAPKAGGDAVNKTYVDDKTADAETNATQNLEEVLEEGNSAGDDNIDMNSQDIKDAGKVGVGTSDPKEDLDVDGNASISSSGTTMKVESDGDVVINLG